MPRGKSQCRETGLERLLRLKLWHHYITTQADESKFRVGMWNFEDLWIRLCVCSLCWKAPWPSESSPSVHVDYWKWLQYSFNLWFASSTHESVFQQKMCFLLLADLNCTKKFLHSNVRLLLLLNSGLRLQALSRQNWKYSTVHNYWSAGGSWGGSRERGGSRGWSQRPHPSHRLPATPIWLLYHLPLTSSSRLLI